MKPDRKELKRRELRPVLAEAFTELGFRRATTAKLARRCGTQEAILYRLWTGKKAMIVDVLDYVCDRLIDIWEKQLSGDKNGPADPKSPGSADPRNLENLLEYESKHFGELGSYSIVFSCLSETDDPEIREALQRMYHRIHTFLVEHITRYRSAIGGGNNATAPATLSAWAFIGLGTMMTIIRHLGLTSDKDREALLQGIGKSLLYEK